MTAQYMILMQAMLDVEMFEHGSANPFASLVSSVEFRINQLKGTPISNKASKAAIVTQLENLIRIFSSVERWVVPESSIRKNLDSSVPVATQHVRSAIESIHHDEHSAAIKTLEAARDELVKHSHIPFT